MATQTVTTRIEYTDHDETYSDAAPSVDLQEQTVTLCDNQSGVVDEVKLRGVLRITVSFKDALPENVVKVIL